MNDYSTGQLADDDTKTIGVLVRLRLPSLVIGLVLGLGLSFVVSKFELVLSENIAIAYFIPFIVYLASAVGAQTQSIYARDLRTGKANFHRYLVKETCLGLLFGGLFAVVTALAVFLWFKSMDVALAVSAAIFCAVLVAPLIGLIVTAVLHLEHTDPAAGAGPIGTIIQDAVTVLIYGYIASAIIL